MALGGVSVAGVSATQAQVMKALGVFRKGMWVRCAGKVGIVNQFVSNEATGNVFAEVHIVDPSDGTTSDIVAAELSSLAQAGKADIPECRRPSDEVLESFGYE